MLLLGFQTVRVFWFSFGGVIVVAFYFALRILGPFG